MAYYVAALLGTGAICLSEAIFLHSLFPRSQSGKSDAVVCVRGRSTVGTEMDAHMH